MLKVVLHGGEEITGDSIRVDNKTGYIEIHNDDGSILEYTVGEYHYLTVD